MISRHSLRITLGAFLALASLSSTACSNQEREAQRLLESVRGEFKEVQALQPSEEALDLREERVKRLERVLARANMIGSRYPNTLIAQGVASGQLDLGGMTLRDVRDNELPKLRRELLAERDPLTTARLLLEQVADPARQAQLLTELAKALDASGRSSEAAITLGDAFAAALQTPPSQRVGLLSAIAFGHADASRRQLALEAAFAALSAAKQISDGPARSDALSQIAISYYVLGIDERGYEALQSVTQRADRLAGVYRVGKTLLEKNLPHQALAASTLLIDTRQRTEFLLSIAEQARQRDMAPAIALLADATLPLIPRLSGEELRLRSLLKVSGLLRNAGQSERATELLDQVQARLSPATPSTVSLSALHAAELAALHQTTASLTLAQDTLELVRRASAPSVPSEARDEALRHLTVAFARLDEPTRAVRAAAQIKNERVRIETFIQGALEAHRSGSTGYAKQMLRDAERLLEGSSETAELRAPLWVSIRDAYLSIGQAQEARRVASLVRQADPRWRASLRSFVQSLMEAGFIEDSLAVARGAPDPSLRAILLADVAKQYSKSNRFGDSSRLLEEASALLLSVSEPTRRRALAALLADAMIAVRWPQRAQSLVEQYKFDDAPLWYCRIAEALAATGQRDESMNALHRALESGTTLPRIEDRALVALNVGRVLGESDTTLPESSVWLLARLVRIPK